jgi:predicted metal-dependent hydrolase
VSLAPSHPDPFRHGVELFNRAEFFDAHEVLEDVWRAAPAAEKKFLQGLIQVAVALHHHSRGNLVGARSLLARALRNLEPCPDGFRGVEWPGLRHALSDWSNALDRGAPLPPLPQVKIRGC